MAETPPQRTFEMSFVWRGCFFALLAAGIGAIGYGIYGLTTGRVEAETVELWVATIVGMFLIPFAITALRHARLTINAEEITYLGFGPLCTTRTLELREIARFGLGREKGSGGGTHAILLLELTNGTSRAIKIESYERYGEFVSALEELTGKARSDTKTGFLGAKLED